MEGEQKKTFYKTYRSKPSILAVTEHWSAIKTNNVTSFLEESKEKKSKINKKN